MLKKSYILNFIIDAKFNIYKIKYLLFLSWDWKTWCLTVWGVVLWPASGPLDACGALGTVWSRTLRSCCNEPAPSWAQSKAGHDSNQLPLPHDLHCRNTWLPTALRHLKALRNSSVQLLLWTDSVLETVPVGCLVWSEDCGLQYSFREFWFY